MDATVSLDSVWNLVRSLSIDNQKWLADKVYEELSHVQRKSKDFVFPHRHAGADVSFEVKAMVADRLPVDIDIEEEKKKKWEELAQ